MHQGVLDAAVRLAAVGHPPGSRGRAFFLEAPHSFSEVAANGVAARDSSVLELRQPGVRAREKGRMALSRWKRGTARFCKPVGGSSRTKNRLQPTEGPCRSRRKRQRGLGGRRSGEAAAAALPTRQPEHQLACAGACSATRRCHSSTTTACTTSAPAAPAARGLAMACGSAQAAVSSKLHPATHQRTTATTAALHHTSSSL